MTTAKTKMNKATQHRASELRLAADVVAHLNTPFDFDAPLATSWPQTNMAHGLALLGFLGQCNLNAPQRALLDQALRFLCAANNSVVSRAHAKTKRNLRSLARKA